MYWPQIFPAARDSTADISDTELLTFHACPRLADFPQAVPPPPPSLNCLLTSQLLST